MYEPVEELSDEVENLHNEIDYLQNKVDRMQHYIYNMNVAYNPSIPKTILYLIFSGIILHLFNQQIPNMYITATALLFGYLYHVIAYNPMRIVYDNKLYTMYYDNKARQIRETIRYKKP